jgi:hypothetical protein
MATCSDVLEECSASIFRVTYLVQADAEVMQRREMCLLYRTVLRWLTSWSHGRWEGPMGFKFSTNVPFFLAVPLGGVNIMWNVTVMSSLPVVKSTFILISIRNG